MILYPSLLASMALAGGPAATTESNKNKHWKRARAKAVKEYVAITSFPNATDGIHYCLRYVGASMAGLEECGYPDLSDDLSLFTFEPLDGYSKGDGYYTMKSAYNGLCKNCIRIY